MKLPSSRLRAGLLLVFASMLPLSFLRADDAAPSAGGVNFDGDVALVKAHIPAVVLSDREDQARVLVAPSLQGRVLTSTTGGANGPSFGWINFKLLASGQVQPHMNAYGGEDRLWLGPEGGQFGLFFPPGALFDFAHWQTPAAFDTEPFDVVKQTAQEVTLRKDVSLVNASGTSFQARIERKVQVLEPGEIWHDLGLSAPDGVRAVGFESRNALTNTGKEAWKESTGLLSIWILGMLNASPDAAVIIPYRQGPESELGQIVESDFFGTVPKERLKVADGIIYFRADAHYRAKIGLGPKRAMPILGSYDPGKHVLTLVQYSPPPKGARYVNSLWKQQSDPFAGSVINSYNDGPNDTGSSMGNFYEVESSSLALAPGETAHHFQRTIHLYGDEAALKPILKKMLGAEPEQIVFP